jgi:tRNA-dihydrouridine synthase A
MPNVRKDGGYYTDLLDKKQMTFSAHRFCVAPMIDWTDRHCRYFHRLLTRRALLYTEMITTHAILHGDRDHLLAFDQAEHPLALQLGGSDPKALAVCAAIGADYGYDEINLNVGCPSDRVQQGRFGACLMAEPNLVGDCVAAMQAAVRIPVTVKTRIGIDNCAAQDFLWRFVETVQQAGCRTWIIHARQAWLKGLSPKQNRDIPPLDYPLVYQLKQDFPECDIILNGGIQNFEEAAQHLQQVDGVMLGRLAYHQPYLLRAVDQQFFGSTHSMPTRNEIMEQLIIYWQQQMQQGIPLQRMLRHIFGLWHGEVGGRKMRQILSDASLSSQAKLDFLLGHVGD